MINVYNATEQTVQPGEALIFDGSNFRNKCSCGNNIIVGSGVYRIGLNLNSTPTVAGQITWNIVADNISVPGGEIQTPGTTVGIFENGSAEVIIITSGRTNIQVINNSENPVTVPANGASLVLKREG